MTTTSLTGRQNEKTALAVFLLALPVFLIAMASDHVAYVYMKSGAFDDAVNSYFHTQVATTF
jgi:hypothetical protein